MADISARERNDLEANSHKVMQSERQQLESELAAIKDDMDKQYIYRREQLRQELTEQHEQVLVTSSFAYRSTLPVAPSDFMYD